ncbi:MAG: hypothetical protein HOV80_27090 [Polyangiaceae bacterium]|nr:hypothetical protein [Polyangiaceae bacterium]
MTVSSAFADQPAYFDAEAAMTAGSNMALVRGGGAAWSNPAGLHTSENNQFDLTVSAFVLRVRDFSRVFRAELPSGTYFPEAEEVTIQPIPSALVYERRLTKDVTAALAILVTAADTMDLTGDLQRTETFSNTPEPVELSARADISSQSQTYRIGPGVSWEISPRVRLGLSTFLVYSSFRDSSVLRLVAKSSAGTAEALGSSRRRISGFGGQMALGAQWELGGGVIAGTTLRTPVVGFGQTGSLSSETSVLSSAGSFPGEQVATTLRPDVPITAGLLSEPAQLVAGLAFKQPTWWLGAEVEVTPPLVRPELAIDEGPEANVRVGGRIWIADAYSLGLGAFTDRDASRSTFRTGEAVVDYYGGATGFEWRSRYSVNDGEETRPLVFSTTVALRYALGIGDLESLVFSPSAATLDEFRRVRPASERVYFHALTVQLGSSLAF